MDNIPKPVFNKRIFWDVNFELIDYDAKAEFDISRAFERGEVEDLHTETVEPETFSLLKKLMELPSLLPFSLVEGTALGLRYGHRSPIDLDLFCHRVS